MLVDCTTLTNNAIVLPIQHYYHYFFDDTNFFESQVYIQFKHGIEIEYTRVEKRSKVGKFEKYGDIGLGFSRKLGWNDVMKMIFDESVVVKLFSDFILHISNIA